MENEIIESARKITSGATLKESLYGMGKEFIGVVFFHKGNTMQLVFSREVKDYIAIRYKLLSLAESKPIIVNHDYDINPDFLHTKEFLLS